MEEEIVISSNVAEVADEGIASLDALGASLDGLSTGAGLSGLSAQLSSVNAELNGLSTGNLDSVSSALDEVGSSDAAGGVEELATGIDSVDAAPIAEAADEAERLAAAGEEGGGAMSAAGGMGARGYLRVAKMAAKAVGVLYDIGKAAVNATLDQLNLREEMTAALDQATRGGGTAAFDSLSVMARKLNLDVGETVGKFTELKTAGATGGQATALIKLGADIEAVGGSSAAAGDAMKRALKQIKAGGNADQVIKNIAKEFGAVGNGANAAAKANLTFTGAMKRLAGAKDQAFADVAKGIEPQLNAIGAKLTSVFGNLSLGDTGLIDALASGLEYVPIVIDGVVGAFDTLKATAGPGITLLASSFDMLGDALGATGGAGSTFKVVAAGIGGVITVVATVISGAITVVTGFIRAVAAISEVGGIVISAISGIGESISSFSLVDAGMNLINSLAEGITAAIGNAVAAAASAGSAVADAVTGALGINSPSTVGVGAGDNTISSLGLGADQATPGAVSAFESAGLATGEALSTGVEAGAINSPSLDGGMIDATGAPAVKGKAGGKAGASAVTINQEYHINGSDIPSEELIRVIMVRNREETLTLLREAGVIE